MDGLSRVPAVPMPYRFDWLYQLPLAGILVST
jgi:hypothetical protein